MILWRVLPWDPSATSDGPGGPLWFPRAFQGGGRHDNRDRYGSLYLAEDPVSAVAEMLAPFRGTGDLQPELLVRLGRPLALARVVLDDAARLIDLDEPDTLAAESLRPSGVATGRRATTQAYAARAFDAHPDAAGLRWWSTLEAAWINVTLFDRARPALTAATSRVLETSDDAVLEAARFLGLAPGS